MSWVRLDDGAPGHRKIVGLSDAAFRLRIVGLTYCNQQANDGRFSVASARIMTGYLASPELGRGAIAELCTAGLWAETSDESSRKVSVMIRNRWAEKKAFFFDMSLLYQDDFRMSNKKPHRDLFLDRGAGWGQSCVCPL